MERYEIIDLCGVFESIIVQMEVEYDVVDVLGGPL
jgi:hypothetical protein